MSLPNYSEDTFTSMTEEEEEEREYGDDSFESYDSADELKEPVASDLTKGAWQSSCQKDEELLDSAFVGESLTRKWINLLKVNRRSITERAKPSIEPDTALPGISEEELGILQSFCVSKINHLHYQRISEPLRRNSREEQRPRMLSQRQQKGGCDSAVPSELVNRLHLKSLKEMMKKIAETEMHQPSQCPFCMKKREGFAKVEFLRRKKTILDNVLLQEKLEDYMYTKVSKKQNIYTKSRCIVLHCIVLCCAVLCCAMLCYPMLSTYFMSHGGAVVRMQYCRLILPAAGYQQFGSSILTGSRLIQPSILLRLVK
ncbi:uncharacterized protein C8orf48 homolog [Ahaetulla prasina]|uniref:uncharacterized protein C8orf48 homolog n=1 Tax=Ahaetulla prasina TaxID=499056 RepID=UPI0026490242|nr:uncharacterized protein C8orf48 homolog [Ahaetulla prasina]XP_058053022.1 uncharacterized protein C8orf48 homolog [Ahaetulla prasina]